MKFRYLQQISPIVFALAAACPAAAQESSDAGQLTAEKAQRAYADKPVYSPYAARNFPSVPLFGDTHLHTTYSVDAGTSGTRLDANDAYRFAKGERITSNTGLPTQLSRPLDFLVVADHSDGLGFFPLLAAGGADIMADPQGRRWNTMLNAGQGWEMALEFVDAFGKGTVSKAIMPVPGATSFSDAWHDIIQAAETANDPGQFTAFIGYEWTSVTGGNNLHRNVIYRDGADEASQLPPYTTQKPLGSDNPVDLWNWMQTYEDTTGGKVLAIAHNGNLSNGLMFPTIEAFGKPADAQTTPPSGSDGNASMRSHNPKAPAKPIPSCPQTMNSPNLNCGTAAILILAPSKTPPCSNMNSPARP